MTAVCSAAKFDLVTRAVASECVDDKTSDFATLGKQWDVIFDVAANRHFSICREALEPHGIYVTTIGSGGDRIAPLLNPVRSQKSPFIMMKPNVSDLDSMRSLVESGKLKANVGRVFPMAQVAAAQALAPSGMASGKVVVANIERQHNRCCTSGSGTQCRVA